MADGVKVGRIIAMLGFIVILTAAVTGNTPAEWTIVRSTIEAGIDFPEFWNPFTENVVRITAFPDFPFRFHKTNDYDSIGESVVGCANTSAGRSECLSSIDGDASYVRVPVDDIGGFQTGYTFNYSNQRLKQLNATSIRQVVLTVYCRTEVNETSALAFFMIWDYNSADLTIHHCPKGEKYEQIVYTFDAPGGLASGALGFTPFVDEEGLTCTPVCSTQFTLGTQQTLDNDPLIENIGLPAARFTYFRIDISYVTSEECTPPEGAWFPAIDEIACAIINFANFVWKGIQFVGSGIAFVILSLASILGFIGSIIVNLFIGSIAIFVSIFSLGAPTPAQEILDVLAISAAGYLVFVVVTVIRGTEG